MLGVCVCVCVCVSVYWGEGASELTISSRDAPDPHSRERLLIGQFPPRDNKPADRHTETDTV